MCWVSCDESGLVVVDVLALMRCGVHHRFSRRPLLGSVLKVEASCLATDARSDRLSRGAVMNRFWRQLGKISQGKRNEMQVLKVREGVVVLALLFVLRGLG